MGTLERVVSKAWRLSEEFGVEISVCKASEDGLVDVWFNGGDRVVENLDLSNTESLIDGVGMILEQVVEKRLKKVRDALGVKETLI